MGNGVSNVSEQEKPVKRLKTAIQDDIDMVEQYENSKTTLKEYKLAKGINFTLTSLKTYKDSDFSPLQVRASRGNENENGDDDFEEEIGDYSFETKKGDQSEINVKEFNTMKEADSKESSMSSFDSDNENSESGGGEKEPEEQENSEIALVLTDLSEVYPSSPFSLIEKHLSMLDDEAIKMIRNFVEDSKLQPVKRKVCFWTNLPVGNEAFFNERETSMFLPDLSEAEVDCWLSKNIEEKNSYFRHKATDKSIIYLLGMASFCMKGRHKGQFIINDYVLYYDPFCSFAVMTQGNGPAGVQISNCVSKFLYKLILEHPLVHIHPLKALQEAFKKMKLMLKKKSFKSDYRIDTRVSGCTALTALRLRDKILVSYVGDILIFIGKKSKSNQLYVPMPLTKPHLPKREDEKKRIYENGGEVRCGVLDQVERIYVRGRVYPGLRVSRSFGNDYASIIGVRSEPEHFSYTIDPATDAFILICSPSLLEFVDIRDIINIYSSFNSKTVKIATDLVANKIRSVAIQSEDIQDDVTFLVMYI